MKKLIYKCALLLLLIIAPNGVILADETDSVDTSLYGVAPDSEPDDLLNLDPKGPRMPAAPLLCTISKTNGVQIAGVDTSEIESFEIRDVYGNTVAVLSDEASFVETLFSLKGEYRVIFQLSDRSLTGWIEI